MKSGFSRILCCPVLLLILCVQPGCTSHTAVPEPSIAFTKLPPYAEGSPQKLDAIEGRATNVLPGQHIVLYAKSGSWWVQPFVNEASIKVQADATWKSQTHPGTSYAALLVTEWYRAPAKTDVLPEKGGNILARTAAEGPDLPPRSPKMLLFGGYEWQVRYTPADPGGTWNEYDPANAWIDRNGFLHLRIAGHPDHWTSAEVGLRRSLGYGSYRFVVRDVSHLEPAAVFLMQSYGSPFRDMDIEVSQWGETSSRNGQFVIQPYYVPANTVQFQIPAATVTFMLRWSPGRASFGAFRGAASRLQPSPIFEHAFTSGVPVPADELIHLNLYVFGSRSSPLQHGTEVIVENFEYLP
jgi:hypothetical protein